MKDTETAEKRKVEERGLKGKVILGRILKLKNIVESKTVNICQKTLYKST